jgi:hypothetical protein
MSWRTSVPGAVWGLLAGALTAGAAGWTAACGWLLSSRAAALCAGQPGSLEQGCPGAADLHLGLGVAAVVLLAAAAGLAAGALAAATAVRR